MLPKGAPVSRDRRHPLLGRCGSMARPSKPDSSFSAFRSFSVIALTSLSASACRGLGAGVDRRTHLSLSSSRCSRLIYRRSAMILADVSGLFMLFT